MKFDYFRGLKKKTNLLRMNIALFGYGKMGREIETLAVRDGHSISARVNRKYPKESVDLTTTDVIIEFSLPQFAAENIRYAIDLGIPIVVGTTGWYDKLDELKAYCLKHNGSILYATNFSIGVNAFFALNRYLGKIMNDLNDYSVALKETHHTEKLDAPSGTGISLAEQIIEVNSSYSGWKNGQKLEKGDLQITSVREEGVPGTHEVTYDSAIDTLAIKHTAHNRKGFAQGSIFAATWLINRKGVFTMQDILNF